VSVIVAHEVIQEAFHAAIHVVAREVVRTPREVVQVRGVAREVVRTPREVVQGVVRTPTLQVQVIQNPSQNNQNDDIPGTHKGYKK